ncbi:MAG: hypothetical protein ABIH69_05880 [bacterium]
MDNNNKSWWDKWNGPITAFFAFIAIVISVSSYKMTERYYDLAYRPYISVPAPSVVSWSPPQLKIAIPIKCLQSPSKIMGTVIVTSESAPKRLWENLEMTNDYKDMVIFPDQTVLLKTNHDYPKIGESKFVQFRIEYTTLNDNEKHYANFAFLFDPLRGPWSTFSSKAN